MGRRADHPLPPALFDLKWDPSTDRYTITREGITYLLTFTHYNDLKKYFREFGERVKVADWYQGLSREEKKQIKRIGLPQEPDDFIPDQSWDD
ncbi:MAG: hypothetical protein J0L83_14755 [Chitinophagales bacterium]|nr:hypothetical protein [Chitinophagales bacterium]